MLEDYEGITPIAKVSLTSLCYLAKISDIPLALKELKTIVQWVLSSKYWMTSTLEKGKISVKIRHDVGGLWWPPLLDYILKKKKLYSIYQIIYYKKKNYFHCILEYIQFDNLMLILI